MNGAATQTFRGYRAIAEVVERMTPLASSLAANRPDIKVITLKRRDLDLIQRWPKAAGVLQIFTTNGVTYWRGFELRADRTPSRYDPS
jgi:hypothetical protein